MPQTPLQEIFLKQTIIVSVLKDRMLNSLSYILIDNDIDRQKE